MEYNFNDIENRWRKYWAENKTFKAENFSSKPKFYILDMFPYPSGSGLHVGHPLGYIASDIYSRYKRLKGYNVLHPMGFDAFGLPAEQYAIQTGQHPAITTEKNIQRYKEQLDKLGLSFDWDREVRTSDPAYYKWTQWTFIQLFNHYYCHRTQKAQPISRLIEILEQSGTKDTHAATDSKLQLTAEQWNSKTEKEKQELLMHYRLAYLSDCMVNWCPGLGTVLANDEVVNGTSVRGGCPVEQRSMKQWFLRITAYADRLLEGLNRIDWSDSLKEIQRNWIGRSEGAFIRFPIQNQKATLDVFTTRPDTIFGVSFMVLAPEHPLVKCLTTAEQAQAVEQYIEQAKNRCERERLAEVKKISGVFTGSYVVHPFTKTLLPIWISDYVLIGYGTGAIMAVPAHDSRDFAFARHFQLPITQVILPIGEQAEDIAAWTDAKETKNGTCINSDFINGMEVEKAMTKVIEKIIDLKIGYGTVNYRLRDVIFSRQRYWGEPFPIYYKEGLPYTLPESELPLRLPDIDAYLPTSEGEPPLARAKNWTYNGYRLDYNTMPGFAGSNAYYLRYMDPKNDKEYFSREINKYWKNVDLYIGGVEHATGHLLYSRFWNKFLYDLGLTYMDEPFQKLVNQGMIQGRSNFVYRVKGTNTFVSYHLKEQYDTDAIHVDINIVDNDVLDLDAFKKWRSEYENAEFILENGKYICGHEIEKMSKSLYNVQNPDDIIEKYGADTLRMYEMFLGPLEQSKPWDIKGIEGVFRFLRKFWKLYHDAQEQFCITNEIPTDEELKVLHKTIKKVEEDIEKMSYNTAVSAFMVCINELSDLKCNKRAVLEPLAVLISPFAPHIAEELWSLLGNKESISYASFPVLETKYLTESAYNYPISFNGKMRFVLSLPIDMNKDEIEKAVLQAPETQKWLKGATPKKIIIVPKKIVNFVV
ncbi:MAG: leucine--tRNA ligase [Bacteroidales bacterium]|jgi:leucyl-tRNA synthetase|nr:leucine--tRNA ligase [Bacteroidales bacterium]